MTVTAIQAVLFDMGGTLEDLYYDDASRRKATRGLHALLIEQGLDPDLSLPDLQAAVLSGMQAYQTWREKTEIELPPERVWAEYIFPDRGLSQDRLIQAAEDLTIFYDNNYHVRSLRPEAPETLEALHRRGFQLGIISNIISRKAVPLNLQAYGIAGYFGTVITSSNLGWRKPNPRIFQEAARLMGLPPAACAYVGDTVSRDVIGARRAGYGLAIQIQSFLTGKADEGIPADAGRPDAVIHNLIQVVSLVTRNGD